MFRNEESVGPMFAASFGGEVELFAEKYGMSQGNSRTNPSWAHDGYVSRRIPTSRDTCEPTNSQNSRLVCVFFLLIHQLETAHSELESPTGILGGI